MKGLVSMTVMHKEKEKMQLKDISCGVAFRTWGNDKSVFIKIKYGNDFGITPPEERDIFVVDIVDGEVCIMAENTVVYPIKNINLVIG